MPAKETAAAAKPAATGRAFPKLAIPWPTPAKKEPVKVLAWLVEASNKAMPSLLADTQLKELLAVLRGVAITDESAMAKARNSVNEQICQIVIDYLRRLGVRHVIVDCVTSVEASRVHCILTLETRGRVATRYLELKP
jgi:hypothetical protein